MRGVIFTSNSIRHKYFANSFSNTLDDVIIISECKQHDSLSLNNKSINSLIDRHFYERYETENMFFPENKCFNGKVIPLLYKEANLQFIFDILRKFEPDIGLVFGSSILQDNILSLIPSDNFLNLHLGISPYYRGSGTNFWPFINDELQFIGSTILNIDAGVDTGDILCHIRPKIEINDNVHSIGCKVIEESVKVIKEIIIKKQNGIRFKRTKQWNVMNEKYYKKSDFTENILKEYFSKLNNNIVERFIAKNNSQNIEIIELNEIKRNSL